MRALIRVGAVSAALVVGLSVSHSPAHAAEDGASAYLATVVPVAHAVYGSEAPDRRELLAMGRYACTVDHPRAELLGSWLSSHRLVNTVVRAAERDLCGGAR